MPASSGTLPITVVNRRRGSPTATHDGVDVETTARTVTRWRRGELMKNIDEHGGDPAAVCPEAPVPAGDAQQ